MHTFSTDTVQSLAGLLEHLACHLLSGRERSARLSAMLAARLAEDADLPPVLRAALRVLADGLVLLPVTSPSYPSQARTPMLREPRRGEEAP